MNDHHRVTWHDSRQEPECPPDPAYPTGIDLDLTHGNTPWCMVKLPYPAKRIGAYIVECTLCRLTIACTTAGRADDPRSVKLPCRMQ